VACGRSNAADARFCNGCGAPLPTDERRTLAERKVITALFCDLVGSTELADRVDPEDLDALLRSYHGLVRRRIEAFGGTVEKFIGDAVVGVFGVPNVHEDDASRAVSAALRVVEEVAETELGVHVRIGIMTGETLVRGDLDPTAGEGLATGDTLNIAARLQGHAPVDGVLVGAATREAAGGAFAWQDAGRLALKGRADPLQAWVARRAKQAGPTIGELTPFVGRASEVDAVVAAFERSRRTPSLEILTIVADPGIGKSRLVREAVSRIAALDESACVLKGRCLPYGDGITFWALGEIVSGYAGILDTDDQATVAARLDAVLTEPDPQLRSWMRDRLGPLVGLRVETAPPQQDETFAAWRRFLVSIARERPLVLVIEDLHWADDALVAFLHSLWADRAAAPVDLIVTARNEVRERHPSWLGSDDGRSVLALAVLPESLIGELIRAALPEAPDDLLATILDRAGGSPLYAEQLAAMLREQGGGGPLDVTSVPPSIQALLAARVDTLPREVKPVLLDASVIGRTFWSGAVEVLGPDPGSSVAAALDDLAKRELVRSSEPSSMDGESEFTFWHALLRDVAYGRLPRRERMEKHERAASWIADRSGPLAGRTTEIVVDHYARAHELAIALGAADAAVALRDRLIDALLRAADHAMRSRPPRAIYQMQRALELTPPEDPRWLRASTTLAAACIASRRFGDAVGPLEAAWATLHARGGASAAAEVAEPLAIALGNSGSTSRATDVLAEARRAIEGTPGPLLVAIMGAQAMNASMSGRQAEAMAVAAETVSLADRLGIPPPARALMALGSDADFVRAIAVADANADIRNGSIGRLNRAIHFRGHADASLAIVDESMAFDEALGLPVAAIQGRHTKAEFEFFRFGRWTNQPRVLLTIIAAARERGDIWTMGPAAESLGQMRLARGEPIDELEGALAAWDQPEMGAVPIRWLRAMVALGADDLPAAQAGLRSLVIDDGFDEFVDFMSEPWLLADPFVRTGDLELADGLVARARPIWEVHAHDRDARALAQASLDCNLGRLLEVRGDLREACAAYGSAMAVFDRFAWDAPGRIARHWLGRSLLALGQRDAATAHLTEARRRAVHLGLRPEIAELDELLGSAVSA